MEERDYEKTVSLFLTLTLTLGIFCLPMSAVEASGLGTSAVPTASTVLVNAQNVAFDAYLINGNNYFKLRDIGAAFNFGVDWDGAKNTIVIDTSKGYTAEGTATTPEPTPHARTDNAAERKY